MFSWFNSSDITFFFSCFVFLTLCRCLFACRYIWCIFGGVGHDQSHLQKRNKDKKNRILPDATEAEGGGPVSPPLFWLMISGFCSVEEGNCSSLGRRSYTDSVKRGQIEGTIRWHIRNRNLTIFVGDSWFKCFSSDKKMRMKYSFFI